jgi:hypothetical protein
LALALSEAPLIKVERSPTGSEKGKSRFASRIARIRYHPAIVVINIKDPAVYHCISNIFEGDSEW